MHASWREGGPSGTGRFEAVQPKINTRAITSRSFLMTFTTHYLHPLRRDLPKGMKNPNASGVPSSYGEKELGGGNIGNTKLMGLFGGGNFYGYSCSLSSQHDFTLQFIPPTVLYSDL